MSPGLKNNIIPGDTIYLPKSKHKSRDTKHPLFCAMATSSLLTHSTNHSIRSTKQSLYFTQERQHSVLQQLSS